jgi:hypothetical protein
LCKQFETPARWQLVKTHPIKKIVKKEKLNPIFGGVDKIVLTSGKKQVNSANVDQTPLTIRIKEIENDPNVL